MKYKYPSLNALKAFNSAAKHMSFQLAAKELKVTPGALSYQIKQLEEDIDVKLFNRFHRVISLTEEGLLLQPYIQEGFAQFNTGLQRLEKKQSQNVINISSGPGFTSKILAPRIYDFITQFPDIDARISATLQLVDLEQRDIDIALRFGKGNYPKCTSVKLFDEYILPLCSPHLLKEGNTVNSPEDLLKYTLIHDDTHKQNVELADWDVWFNEVGVEAVKIKKEMHFSNADHAIDAAISGAGVVLGRETLAMNDIKTKRLIAPFNHKIKSGYSFYAVFLEERADEPNIKNFCNWLIKSAIDE